SAMASVSATSTGASEPMICRIRSARPRAGSPWIEPADAATGAGCAAAGWAAAGWAAAGWAAAGWASPADVRAISDAVASAAAVRRLPGTGDPWGLRGTGVDSMAHRGHPWNDPDHDRGHRNTQGRAGAGGGGI